MCNLSEGIFEKGYDKANQKAEKKMKKQILNFLKNGVSISIIAKSMEVPYEEIEAIAAKNHISIVQ